MKETREIQVRRFVGRELTEAKTGIKATVYDGIIAVHQWVDWDGNTPGGWEVSHAPSGLYIRRFYTARWRAEKFAENLAEFVQEWGDEWLKADPVIGSGQARYVALLYDYWLDARKGAPMMEK